MGKLNQLYTMGWYGDCGNQPCESYDLNNDATNQIEGIWRIGTDTSVNNGYESYIASLRGQGINAFESLSCGSSYLIKLQDAVVSDGLEVTIPGFKVSNSDTNSGYVTDNCEGLPVSCCEGYDHYYVTDGLGGEHSATAGLSAEYFDNGGKLCFNNIDIIPVAGPSVSVSGVWKDEVSSSTPFGVIVITGVPEAANETFSYVALDGKCWEGQLNATGENIVITES